MLINIYKTIIKDSLYRLKNKRAVSRILKKETRYGTKTLDSYC